MDHGTPRHAQVLTPPRSAADNGFGLGGRYARDVWGFAIKPSPVVIFDVVQRDASPSNWMRRCAGNPTSAIARAIIRDRPSKRKSSSLPRRQERVRLMLRSLPRWRVIRSPACHVNPAGMRA